MPIQKIFLLPFLLLCACSSPQLIRISDYYPVESGLIHWGDKNSKHMRHHPKYAEVKGLSKEGPPQYSEWLNFYVFGLVPSKKTISVSDVCAGKSFRQAYVSNGLWQGTLTLLTVGLYSPRTIEVWCGPIDPT